MKRATLTISILFSTLLGSACQAANPVIPRAPKPSTREEILKLYDDLSFLDWSVPVTALPQEKGKKYLAENVLPRIHGWLAEGQGLKRIKISGYELLELKTIPRQVLSEIVAVTVAESAPNPGFGLLQASTWKKISELQAKRTRVAFLSKAPQSVLGVYFDRADLLAMDVFSNAGTLGHELRHRDQFLALAKTDREEDEEEQVLDDKCLSAASAFFAELDATTFQLPSWLAVIPSIRAVPGTPEEAQRIGSWAEPTLPKLLSTNLEYPALAADGFLRSDACPSELAEAAKAVQKLALDEKASVADDSLSSLGRVWVDSVAASARAEDLASFRDTARNAKETIVRHLAAAAAERPAALRDILNRLPEDMRGELCRYAAGFVFLADCENKGATP